MKAFPGYQYQGPELINRLHNLFHQSQGLRHLRSRPVLTKCSWVTCAEPCKGPLPLSAGSRSSGSHSWTLHQLCCRYVCTWLGTSLILIHQIQILTCPQASFLTTNFSDNHWTVPKPVFLALDSLWSCTPGQWAHWSIFASLSPLAHTNAGSSLLTLLLPGKLVKNHSSSRNSLQDCRI